MKFIDELHKNFFEKALQADGTGNDPERRTLFFALGLTSDTRLHIWDLYDFRAREIKLEGLNASWQTSGTRDVTRFAFNLYSNFQGEDVPGEDPAFYTPYALFGGPFTEYMLEAIKVRFPESAGT